MLPRESKKVGQSIDLHGEDDLEVCREAGVLWNEPTTDGYPNVRAKIDAELQDLKDEFESGGLTWCERDVKRLIDPYPKHVRVDRVLENLGEDFYHDSIHRLLKDDMPAVAAGEAEAPREDQHEHVGRVDLYCVAQLLHTVRPYAVAVLDRVRVKV